MGVLHADFIHVHVGHVNFSIENLMKLRHQLMKLSKPSGKEMLHQEHTFLVTIQIDPVLIFLECFTGSSYRIAKFVIIP